MKASEQQDSTEAFMAQANGIKKQRKRKNGAAKKKMALPYLSTALFDSLESYDQVLSCASKGTLHFCSLLELHSVLKVNGFQFYPLKKDYIEKNFSVLSGVLFQTRFSSLVTGDTGVTAVVLEDSEVVQDLAALEWLDRTRKDLVLQSPVEEMSKGGRQPADCAAKVTLDGPADDLVEPVAAISSLKTSQPADTSVEGSTDLIESSADDCYRPDMGMIMMLESIQARSCPSMWSPDQRGLLCLPEEILMNGPVSQPVGGLLTESCLPLFCFEEQPFHSSPPSVSHGIIGSPSQEEHAIQSSHTSLANVEISGARVKLKSEEEDMMECQSLQSSFSIMYSLPFTNGQGLKILDQNHTTSAFPAKNPLIFEPEAEQLVQPNYEEISKVKNQSSYSSVSSPGLVEEPAQPSPLVLEDEHSAIANQEFHQAGAKSELNEKIDLVEKFAMEALEVKVLHGSFKEDDLSDIQLLDETTSEGIMHFVANVHDFIELEEDQSSNSCQIQEVKLNFPLCVVPTPQQTSSAEGNFMGFLGLLAQVSTGHSNPLNCSNCSLEEEHAMFDTKARSCTKRLFIVNDGEVSVGREAA